jgi:hypothetical protein
VSGGKKARFGMCIIGQVGIEMRQGCAGEEICLPKSEY